MKKTTASTPLRFRFAHASARRAACFCQNGSAPSSEGESRKRSSRRLLRLLPLVLIAFIPLCAQSADPNETARFLAGMPVHRSSPLAPLTADPSWQQHAQFFESSWEKLETRQLSRARAWSGEYLRRRSANVFYMFSGPDFLYAHALFPGAANYVLCGIEPVGPVPDVTRVNVAPALGNLQASLNSVLNYSFFQTKEMRLQLGGGQLTGTLPVLYVFLARSGKTIHNVSFVKPRGVRIDFSSGGSAGVQTLYYFSVDLSNGSVERSGLLSFCRSLGRGDSLLKSASYLPHQNRFSSIRSFLLEHSNLIVQDDSGIPLRYFDPGQWRLRFFGSYQPPIEIFKEYYQPDLAGAFSSSNPGALTFGIGYRGWNPRSSALVVALRK